MPTLRDPSDVMTPNGPHHLPAEAGEARCSRSGACGCWAASISYSLVGEPVLASARGPVVARLGIGIKFGA
jgi:hypothetical protein